MQIYLCVLTFASAFLFVQCGLNEVIDWKTSANIAVMMFVYGFPYILVIPAIWDLALANSAK